LHIIMRIEQNVRHEDKPETGTKRALPVLPRKGKLVAKRAGVEDEWGAVTKQQAEYERKVQDEEKAFYRAQQRRYKDDLDQQRVAAVKKNKLCLNGYGQKTSLGINEGETFLNDVKEHRKVVDEALLQKINEKKEQNQAEKKRKQEENDRYQKYVRDGEEAEEKKKEEEKNRRQEIANSLISAYEGQSLERKKQRDAQKRLDHLLVATEEQRVPHCDLEKIRVFQEVDILWLA